MGLTLMTAERLLDCLRIFSGNLEQRTGRTMWMTATLLPVSQRCHADADHECKFVLRLSELLSDCLHIFRRKCEFPTWLGFTAKDPACFANAFDQLIKVFLFHLMSGAAKQRFLKHPVFVVRHRLSDPAREHPGLDELHEAMLRHWRSHGNLVDHNHRSLVTGHR